MTASGAPRHQPEPQDAGAGPDIEWALGGRPRRLDTQILSDLYVFQQVVRAAGMGAAARQIGITQGAVSQRIARLEARLGAPLFRRGPDGLRLTPKGKPLASAADSALNLLVHALAELNPETTRTVRVNCTPSLASEWLVPDLEGFYAAHPGLELVIHADQDEMTAARMADEGIDIAVRYGPDDPPGLVELACVQEFIAPVRSPGQVCALSARLHDETPWSGAGPSEEWRAWDLGGYALLATARDQRFNLASLAYDAAVCGHGVAMGRLALVSRRLQRGELVAADRRIAAGGCYRILAQAPPPRRSAAMIFARWAAGRIQEAQARARQIIEGPAA